MTYVKEVRAKADPKLVEILFQAQNFQQCLSDVKTTLNVWRQKGLSQNETIQLMAIFQKIKKQTKEVKDRIELIRQNLSSTNEQHMQTIDNLLQLRKFDQSSEIYRDSKEYQSSEMYAIDKHFNEIRVREVHYRNQAIKVYENRQGVIRQLGYNSKNDEPVEVYKVPKMFNDLYEYEVLLNTFNAYKELIFSPYSRKFLGSNLQADPNHNLYFCQFLQSQSIRSILSSAKFKLTEDLSIYHYWIREIFYGLKDLLYMSRHMPVLPINLNDIHVMDRGITVILKEVRFVRLRKGPRQRHQVLEGRLLRNFGLICLELLGLDENTMEEIRGIDFKCLIKTLLSAQKQQINVQKGISSKCLTFNLLRSQPLLTTKNIPDLQPCVVYSNYKSLVGN